MGRTDTPRAFADIAGTNADYRSPGADKADGLIGASSESIRALVLRRTIWEARRLGSSVELTTAGDQGEHRILVTPDGQLSAADKGSSADVFIELLADAGDVHDVAPLHALRTPAPLPGRTPPKVDSVRPSFIDPALATTADGLVGALTRWGAPIRPTAAQARHLENVRATSRHWAGYRAIAVANGKGGVGKTMTSAMLAAVFARNGGGGVLAWDNNDTRGTLGWRTESADHDATIIDAVAAAPALLDPAASAADIAGVVHHQGEDRYDVLRSNPQLLATEQRIGGVEFDQLLQVAARYYRLVIFDSGNDESAPRWLRMIDSAHQLVIPTLTAPESAESAALLLEALADRDERSAELAHDAVVVVTQAERGDAAEAVRVGEAFAGLVRAVQVIPFDPVLKRGPLRFDALRPVTRRAWVAAGAAIATGLH
ncbi:MAG: ParA family protein [Microbacteriaceae bacterium]|nr:ParA family protein [Microbacteriaceae bacterium]